MPIARRQDEPGSLHHVINRGIARRTLFETRRDCRKLLSLFARAVHRGQIELIDFALMTTHFHALVRCLDGNLSRTIGWIEQQYVRWFNRGRRRDGPLHRSRFLSYRIWTPPHERSVRLYILENPVVARLARRPEDYPWSSAAFRARPRPPLWLALRPPIVARRTEAERAAARWVVERSLRGIHPARAPDAAESLLDAAPAAVRAWMERKALLADGTVPGVVVAAPSMIDAALVATPWPGEPRDADARLAHDDRIAPRVFLLRSLAGLTWGEIARHCRVPRSSAQRAGERHFLRARGDADYRAWSAVVARRAIERTLGKATTAREAAA